MRDMLLRMPSGLAICAVLLVTACGRDAGDNVAGGNAQANASSPGTTGTMAEQKPAPVAKPFSVTDNTEFLEFTYAYPAQAAAVPQLVSQFGKSMETGKADALKMAKDDAASAKKSDFPFHAHSLETRWSVRADTPRFLSLESESYIYTGGAHGMTGYNTVLWDKARNREATFKMMITDEGSFARAINARFCKALDDAREEKRGAPVKSGADTFSECIDPMKEVLVPVSKDGKLIDGVAVVIGPYSAGPYAEGSYDVVLPVDAAMRKAIKTEYQNAFVPAA